jgi:hypothetical protein
MFAQADRCLGDLAIRAFQHHLPVAGFLVALGLAMP